MKYSIKVNEVKVTERKQGDSASYLKGFATLVFGDSFKITNIAILESNEGKTFISMPRYRSYEKNEQGKNVYKDICHPITKEFREELYDNILEVFENIKEQSAEQGFEIGQDIEMPEFKVTVTPFEREGSNVRGLARVYFEDSFIINNVSVLQGKGNNLFVSMPSYKTKQVDENNKAVYQDVCYPVTKEFREKLYEGILNGYHEAKEKVEEKAKKEESTELSKNQQSKELPFR